MAMASPRAFRLCPEPSSFAPSKALGVIEAFKTAQPEHAAPLCSPDFGDPMLFANRTASACIAPVHPAMFNRVDALKVLGTAASVDMAFMVDVLPRRPVQRLIDKPMNLHKLPVDPDVTVTVTIFGPGPNPTIAINEDARVKAGECFMCEHDPSIYLAGFKATQFAPSTLRVSIATARSST